MNATLSQNVQGISIQSNEVPPLNITEQVQLTFKVDIHYIRLYLIQVDITCSNRQQKYIYTISWYIYKYIQQYTPRLKTQNRRSLIKTYLLNPIASLHQFESVLLIYSFLSHCWIIEQFNQMFWSELIHLCQWSNATQIEAIDN